jgi:hypothetical protein
MIKKNGGNSGLRELGKGQNDCIFKTKKMDNVNVLIIEDTPVESDALSKVLLIAIIWLVLRASDYSCLCQ